MVECDGSLCFLIALFLAFFEKKIIRVTKWLYMKRTGGLLVLSQNKWILLLLKGWKIESIGLFHGVSEETLKRSKMANLALIRFFSEKVAVYL